MKIFWVLSVVLLSLSVNAESHLHVLFKHFPKAELFNYEHKKFEQVNFVGGEINYQEGEHEGYLASIELKALGESYQYIHDYSSNDSSIHIFQEMLDRLEEHKFEILYDCAQSECGDLSAWQLYLTNKVHGDELTQHYVLAKQRGREGNEWYVQFYTIDLDGEPRSFMKLLNSKERPEIRLAINHQLLLYPTDKEALLTLDDILFQT
ncbi:MAG: hypothetical protein OXE99_10175, partial [Cellvibrionales bacterium]|nr:hypothetical protein [Cellvibrionales bacterium]